MKRERESVCVCVCVCATMSDIVVFGGNKDLHDLQSSEQSVGRVRVRVCVCRARVMEQRV